MSKFAVLAIAASVAASSLGAQVMIAPRTTEFTAVAPSATATVAPISNGFMFNGAWTTVIAARVNVYSAAGPVMIQAPPISSEVGIVTNNGPIPNGTYSVQFYFTYSAVSTTVKIATSSATLTQCTLKDQENWNTPEQVCDSGMFDITNNRLAVSVLPVSGNAAVLTRIVINAYPTLKLR